MTIDEIRRWYSAEPFQPFEIRLGNGCRFAVEDRLHLGLGPQGRTVIVGLDDHFEVIDVPDIDALTPIQTQSADS